MYSRRPLRLHPLFPSLIRLWMYRHPRQHQHLLLLRPLSLSQHPVLIDMDPLFAA